jgi:hypothetical protein
VVAVPQQPPTPPSPKTPEKKEDPLAGNQLFASLGKFFNERMSAGRDVDYRKLTQLSCLRKLFEEARQANMQSLNAESDIFAEMPKNFDGVTIKKDDFVYALLNNKAFSLTRTEISNITSIFALPSQGVFGKQRAVSENSIDLEEVQRSYRSYLIHYQSVEGSIHDLMERIYYGV